MSTKLEEYVVLESDADINCPLFRKLQSFLRAEHHFRPETAHRFAVQFMREHWLSNESRDILRERNS